MSMNTVNLMGRLVRDAEIRTTESGVSLASFCIAVDRDYAPKGAERESDFINCTAFRQTADFVSKYFHKGSLIALTGRLQTRKFTDKEGNNRTVTEVVVESVYFTGERKSSDSIPGGTAMRYNENRAATPTSKPATVFVPADDEDVPF